MIGGWQLAFDPVLYTLHEGTGRMAGNVDSLCPLLQGQAETAAFLFRSLVGALQFDQVGKPLADTVSIAFRPLIV